MKRHVNLLFFVTVTLFTTGLVACNSGVAPIHHDITKVTGVSLNHSSLTLSKEATYTLTATVSPDTAVNQNVSWSSSNNEVVSVDSRGKVTGVEVGSATITVTTEEGGFADTCVVTVTEDAIPVTGVSLNYETANLYVGKTMSLTATVEPVTATNQEVTWSSSASEFAEVSNSGVITANAVGQSTITVTTVDGGYSASCLVNVIEQSSSDDYVPDFTDPDILFITSDIIPEDATKYECSVSQNYKQIYVNAPEIKVTINLEGATIENTENSPIYVADCDSISLSAKNSKVNYIKDKRATYTEDVAGQGKGSIYVANGDLSFKGKGELNIEANYYNGVHGKDDVEIKNLTLNVTAVNHGIRGNDSVTIESGIINISCGGDGLHTENSDISSKGNQRGNVTISGGTITINSWGDAIQASYDAFIEEASADVPVKLNLSTNKYSTYDGEVIDTSDSKFYIKMNSSTYSSGGYTYAAYINNEWYRATYKGTQSSGGPGRGPGGPGGGGGPGGSTYYIYEIERPAESTSFKLYRFSGSNVTSYSTSNYNAASDAKAFNDAYDMVQISVYSGRINFGNWSNYSSSGAGADISAKGIKAENEVTINGGTFIINAYDDGIHANNDGSLENGSTPLGNVDISGGTFTIKAADDAIHADYNLNITDGTINVTESYEGLEGNVINISGGVCTVFATDDGVNATTGKSSPTINVSGGYLDVTVPTSGDTDGIDSNGTYTQTGGVVIIRGPGKASGGNGGAAALDTDSTVRITSGTLIVFGGIEQTPVSSVTKTLCSSSTVSAGSHKVTFASQEYNVTLKYSTNGCVVYSSLGTATLS